jgi:proton-dependent oligopeptide transporter, POT family
MKHIFKDQPKEFISLSLAGICLRYAFWGIGNLLVIYLIEHYKFSTIKATHTYGIFTAFAAFLPLLGGYVADKWNYYHPIIVGTIASGIGCILVTFGQVYLLYIALALLACGYGLFIPSVFTVLNYAYKDKDHHVKETGFSLYYASFNFGVLLAMISIGYVAHAFSWEAAFYLAAIVQFLGLIPAIHYIRKYHLTYDDIHPKSWNKNESEKNPEKKTKHSKKKLSKIETDRIIVIGILCILTILFWSCYNQGWSSFSIFTLKYVDKSAFGLTIPIAWILALESLFLVIITPFIASFYHYLHKKNKNPSPIAKSAIGLTLMAVCFLVMVLATLSIAPNASFADKSPIYLAFSYFFMAFSEMFFSPIGLSSVTKLSPKKYIALSVGIYYLCYGVGSYIAGYLAGFIAVIPKISTFFSIFIGISLVGAISLFIFCKKINKMRHFDKF